MDVLDLFKKVKSIEPNDVAYEIYDIIMKDSDFLNEVVGNAAFAYAEQVLIIQDKLSVIHEYRQKQLAQEKELIEQNEEE